METKTFDNAIIIVVGHSEWNSLKSILMAAESGERLDDIAKNTFEKYKDTQNNKDIYLVTYQYHGEIEVIV